VPKKIILVLIAICFLSPFNLARADVGINEIMYDPLGSDTNVEYIKVQNTGVSQIDLSTWYVADYDISWHFHKIIGEKETVLGVGAYALIVNTSQVNFADFKTKTPNYSGLLFRASFTLGNDKGRLGMSPDKKNILSDTTYIAPIPPTPIPVVPTKIVAQSTAPAKISTTIKPLEVKPVPDEQIPTEDLPATSAGRQVSASSSSSSIFILLSSIMFIGVSASAVYFIRRKKVTPQAGSDFEILDE